MTDSLHAIRWPAFYLSLIIPGAGQLWLRHASGFIWLSLAVEVGVLSLVSGSTWLSIALWIAAGAIALLSAEHTKRICEARLGPARRASSVRWQPRSGQAIAVHTQIEVPYSGHDLWKRISDLGEFLTIDPMHDRIILARPEAATGVDLVLWHSILGFRFRRVGEILSWRPGAGYSFSDLSARGSRKGFPHVFHYRVVDSDAGSALVIDVRGKWTIAWLPKWMISHWLMYVCKEHARLLQRAL